MSVYIVRTLKARRLAYPAKNTDLYEEMIRIQVDAIQVLVPGLID